MNRALCLIRPQLVYRREAFLKGLRAAKYAVVDRLDTPDRDDIVVMWNRYGQFNDMARRFERVGARVIVIENGYLGKSWLGDRWFAASVGQHNGAGSWPDGDGQRWDSFGVELQPWRSGGKERLILAQRGIGSVEVRSPDGWAERTKAKYGGRIRPHPGKEPAKISLDDDLADAASVITWGSSAALRALMLGVPVWYEYPCWIGAIAGKSLAEFYGPGGTLAPVKRSDTDRLAMFRRLAWAMWRASEVEDGTMFRAVLQEEALAA